jgi:hypothetical protein
MVTTVRDKLHRLLKIFLFGTGLAALLSFLAAIGVSKVYWGYFIRRPSVDRRIHQIEQVVSLTALRSEKQRDGSVRFVTHDGYDIADRLSVCRDDRPWISYYCLEERILAALDDQGKLPVSPERMPFHELAALYHWLEATQLLHRGAPGYDRARELTGIALVTEGRGSQRYLIVGVTGGQVSNDHHPYYEFLFRLSERAPNPVLLSCRRFFYDVAGYEGLEWWAAWLVLFPAGMVILVLASVVLAIISVLKRQRPSDVSEL